MEEQTWQDRGACKLPENSGVDWFTSADSIECGEICDGCPVIETCRAWAIAHEPYWYWGGMSEAQRRDLRAQRGIQLAEELGLDEPVKVLQPLARDGTKRTSSVAIMPIPHGTRRGYMREAKLNLPHCARCTTANAEYQVEYRKTHQRKDVTHAR